MSALAKGYPTVYRRARRGYQPPRRMQRPANDPGVKRLYRGSPVPPVKAMKRAYHVPNVTPATKALLRLNPWLRLGKLVLNTYELLQAPQSGVLDRKGWQTLTYCKAWTPMTPDHPQAGRYRIARGGGDVGCPVSQAWGGYEDSWVYKEDIIPIEWDVIWLTSPKDIGPLISQRWDGAERLGRSGATETPNIVDTPPFYYPGRIDLPWPALDPLHLPIQQPVPVPRPLPYRAIPYRRPSPLRSPRERTHRGPGAMTGGRTAPLPPPGIGIGPSGRPYPLPASAGARKPPPPGTREKKMILSTSGTMAGNVFGGITEISDFVGALHEALPLSARGTKKKGLPQQMRDLYDHYDKINLGQALQNLIQNQLEDAALGRIGKIAAKANRRHPLLRIQLGPAL